MKKIIIAITAMSLSTVTYANWFQAIINAINAQGMISNGWLSSINNQQSALLNSQQLMDKLMQKMNSHLTGHSGWGSYQFHDYQSYGSGARDWSDVLRMANSGGGSGELGRMITRLAKEFPTNNAIYNRGVSNAASRNYYALQSKTILATRAASQVDYNKIQEQIAYQQMLQQQIERTRDLKGAIDLSNRIQVEGNLITLEILRQSALANQQQAINAESGVMSSLANAKFLTKK